MHNKGFIVLTISMIIEVIDLSKSNFIVVTTPTVAGYKIKKVLGMVTGLAPRTRGVGGSFTAAFSRSRAERSRLLRLR